jgi:hypothetical protein
MSLPPGTRNDYRARLVVKQDPNNLAELPVADDGYELTLDLTCRGRVLLTTKN